MQAQILRQVAIGKHERDTTTKSAALVIYKFTGSQECKAIWKSERDGVIINIKNTAKLKPNVSEATL